MSWYDLLSIYRDASDMHLEDQAQPPQACPVDGEPLRQAPDGGLYCPFDGWRPDGA